MIPGIGATEMVIIAIVAIVLFGSKLPDVARNLGKSYNQFRAGLNELKSSVSTDIPDLRTDLMPRYEKIRHYSDVDPVPPKLPAPAEDDIPLFAPPPAKASDASAEQRD